MDNILITMPKSPREFFLAMPVIQDYLFQYIQEVKHGARDPRYDITFRMSEEYSEYELPLKVAKDINPSYDYTGWTVKNRSEFTCFIDFDFKTAEKMSLVTRKHVTECLGILIGSTPRKWPIIQPRCTQGKGILILNWYDGDHCRMTEEGERFKKHFKDVNLVSLKEFPIEAVKILDVDMYEGVIGPASVITHLVAAYSRPVVEIFPDMASYYAYNQEGIHAYQAVIADPQSIAADLLISAWENMKQFENFEVANAEQILDEA